ncbi:MAG TPA: folylpolyglutamate synthase/dihydrofolate synthase family protein [Nitrospiria bacterium]|nr:folylpolyglutamate synthase/dihydrofolate synthase family protein [Nitrospiria bacterium]
MTYHKTLEALYRLQKEGIKPGLARMEALLSSLGNPHLSLKFIHVGGTNGKGSTASMMASILREAGYRVGLYTSPHLVDFTERIRVNDAPVSRDDVVSLSREISENLKTPPSFFEFSTAMAFLHFLRTRVDIAVIEVGLGGRWDSTNVIRPLLSVITNVDLDHQEYLGSTLREIGNEKAGIIKEMVPVLTAAVQPEVRSLIRKAAKAGKSSCFEYGTHFHGSSVLSTEEKNIFEYRGISLNLQALSVPLAGVHQVPNASLALASLELLRESGFNVQPDHMRSGLSNVRWPGRLELVQRDPLIFLDGAHNPAGAKALARFLSHLDISGRKVLVLGIMKDKAIREMGEILIPWADEVVLTQASFPRAASLLYLKSNLPGIEKPLYLIESVSDALHFARDSYHAGDAICFTGSLYTIGEVKAALDGSPIYLPLHG